MTARPSSASARGVLRNTSALALARVADRLASLVLTLVIAAQLGVGGVGAFAIAMAFYGVITLLGETGTTMFLIRQIAREPERTAEYVVHLSVVAGGVCLLLGGAAAAVVPLLGYSAGVASGVLIVLLALLPRTLNTIQEAAFVAHARSELEAVTTLLATGVYVGVGVWLLETGHGVHAVLWTFVIVEYAATAVYFVLINTVLQRLRARFSWAVAKPMVREVRAFAGSSTLAALLARPEVIILSALASATAVGYYSAALRVAEVWTFVPQVFLNTVYPLLSRSFKDQDGRFYAIQRRAMRAVQAYTLPITAGLLAAAPAIVETLFGRRFESTTPLLRILAVNLSFYALSSVFWRSLAARDRQDVVFRVQLLMVLTRVGGGVLLIALWAQTGAAISAAASSLLMLLLLARATRRTGVATPSPLDGWRFALAAGIMAGAVAAALQVLSLWPVVGIGLVAYGVALVALRALTAEDMSRLRSAR